MSSKLWVPGWARHDLSGHRGNGPYRPGQCLGVVLHVNDSGMHNNGTPASFYVDGGGPNDVCPNIQIMRTGRSPRIAYGIQLIPVGWSPWCQSAGNGGGSYGDGYMAIETGGSPKEPLTPGQCEAISRYLAFAHVHGYMPLKVADHVGQRGFGWHGMGGNAWGGHFGCPGDLRKHQRGAILARAQHLVEGAHR